MENDFILVTGGAGYIGSHVVRQLGESGYRIVTLDNLSTGYRDAITAGEFVEGDTGDAALLDQLFEQYPIKSVIHFAALTVVPESVTQPAKYYRNNTCNTLTLLNACVKHGVKYFIFSSTAAVYGIVDSGVAVETTATNPISPYGTAKLMSEKIIQDIGYAHGLRYINLRYFNVAGSDPKVRIGQSNPNSTLLIKVAAQVAVGLRESLAVYGTDYPTLDGTGVRDYIHVEDLAAAHIEALQFLAKGGQSDTFNVGYGSGYSVKEVIDTFNHLLGRELPVHYRPRREGDLPSLIANCDKLKNTLAWVPRHANLKEIVESSIRWERKLLNDKSV